MTAARHNNENLFAQAARPRASFGTVLLFLITFVMVIGGFYLMGMAFDLGESMEAVYLFSGGVLLDSIAFWIAFGLLAGREKAGVDS